MEVRHDKPRLESPIRAPSAQDLPESRVKLTAVSQDAGELVEGLVGFALLVVKVANDGALLVLSGVDVVVAVVDLDW